MLCGWIVWYIGKVGNNVVFLLVNSCSCPRAFAALEERKKVSRVGCEIGVLEGAVGGVMSGSVALLAPQNGFFRVGISNEEVRGEFMSGWS